MLVVVFGATGGIGRHVVEEALRAGHDVRAATRDPSTAEMTGAHTTWVQCDLADTDSIRDAVAGSHAVLWAVGPTRNASDQVPLFENAATALVAAMSAERVRRLVALSGAGITVDGERKPLRGRAMSAVVSVVARHVVAAKQREYDVIKHAHLDWVLVRPPRVVEGARTGRYAAGVVLAAPRVTQGDLAAFMVSQLTDDTYLRRAPFVSSP